MESMKGRIELPKGGAGRVEQLKRKKCQFPGCDEYYMGTGFSKYCHPHRGRQFRKAITNSKIKNPTENPNQTYKHDFEKPADITFKCDCCGQDFSVKVYPTVNIYPRFCEDHRAEFRRIFYRKINNIIPIVPEIMYGIEVTKAETLDFEEEMDGVEEQMDENISMIQEVSCSAEYIPEFEVA